MIRLPSGMLSWSGEHSATLGPDVLDAHRARLIPRSQHRLHASPKAFRLGRAHSRIICEVSLTSASSLALVYAANLPANVTQSLSAVGRFATCLIALLASSS